MRERRFAGLIATGVAKQPTPAQATGHRPQATDHRPQATGHRPQATGHRPQATGHRPQATGHRPQATGHRPQATGHRPQATGHRPQATGHRPQATGHRPQATGDRRQATGEPDTRRVAAGIIYRVERITLDMTAIRDATYDDRERHRDALKPLELAKRDVELGVPPQGSRTDKLDGQFGGDLVERVRGLLSEPGVVELPQVARLSEVTVPGADLLPGVDVHGLHEAWDTIVPTGSGREASWGLRSVLRRVAPSRRPGYSLHRRLGAQDDRRPAAQRAWVFRSMSTRSVRMRRPLSVARWPSPRFAEPAHRRPRPWLRLGRASLSTRGATVLPQTTGSEGGQASAAWTCRSSGASTRGAITGRSLMDERASA